MLSPAQHWCHDARLQQPGSVLTPSWRWWGRSHAQLPTAAAPCTRQLRHPHIQFDVLDGGDVAGACALLQQPAKPPGAAAAAAGAVAYGTAHKYTRVFVDISGQAPLTAIVPLLQTWLAALDAAPGQLIVKNRALHR